LTAQIINNIPKTTDEIHLWCLYSAAVFLVLSFLNHLLRGEIRQFGALVAIKHSVSGIAFPYSFALIFVFVAKSILQVTPDIERFLSVAGIVLTILLISALFKIGCNILPRSKPIRSNKLRLANQSRTSVRLLGPLNGGFLRFDDRPNSPHCNGIHPTPRRIPRTGRRFIGPFRRLAAS
jgi:hypothetical protein